jgi:polyhydroxybutyrate depolymerase
MRRIPAALIVLVVALFLAACMRAFGRDKLTHAGRERTYSVHVPATLTSTAVPLVLVFHGGGGRSVERFARMNPIADREGFIAAYPDGVEGNWNDLRETDISVAHREKIDDVGFVAALIETLSKAHPIDPKRIYACGISNGAIFAQTLAARLSGKIAAVASVCGTLPPAVAKAFAPEQPVAVAILNGTEDPLVPFEGGDVGGEMLASRGKVLSTDATIRKWIERNGCAALGRVEALPDADREDGCTVERHTWTAGATGADVVLYKIAGGGHTWPGGAQYLPERRIGRVCRDFDGSEAIWAFFAAHPRK